MICQYERKDAVLNKIYAIALWIFSRKTLSASDPRFGFFQDSPIREKFLLGISYYCVYRLFLWLQKIFRRESRDYLSYILRANIC